jgi:SOS-response transcriptional repressor LexA
MEILRMRFGDNIKQLREAKGWTWYRLANEVGISPGNMKKIESGEILSPGVDVAWKIAQVFGVSLDALMSDQPIVKKPDESVFIRKIREIVDQYDSKAASNVEDELKRTFAGSAELSYVGGVLPLPVRGTVRAGTMGLMEQEDNETLLIARSILESVTSKPDEVYALKVAGESLNGDNIHDGDYILVEPTSVLDGEGKIYVIRDPQTGESVIRHLYKKDGELMITSSNPAYKPMVLKQVEIIGRVIYRHITGSVL